MNRPRLIPDQVICRLRRLIRRLRSTRSNRRIINKLRYQIALVTRLANNEIRTRRSQTNGCSKQRHRGTLRARGGLIAMYLISNALPFHRPVANVNRPIKASTRANKYHAEVFPT